jgi:hypothetical protein
LQSQCHADAACGAQQSAIHNTPFLLMDAGKRAFGLTGVGAYVTIFVLQSCESHSVGCVGWYFAPISRRMTGRRPRVAARLAWSYLSWLSQSFSRNLARCGKIATDKKRPP